MNWINLSKVWFFCVLFFCLSWTPPANGGVITNENITVTVGNEQSWTGRNGTGNLSYYGCDRSCECIYLTGGKITCRQGVCQTVWQNQSYTYVLSSPIAQVNAYSTTPTNLEISSDSQVILEAELYPKPFDNLKDK